MKRTIIARRRGNSPQQGVVHLRAFRRSSTEEQPQVSQPRPSDERRMPDACREAFAAPVPETVVRKEEEVCVSHHDHLLSGMHNKGIWGNASEFERNPSLRVMIGTTLSEHERVVTGCPKATVSGNLLFIYCTFTYSHASWSCQIGRSLIAKECPVSNLRAK